MQSVQTRILSLLCISLTLSAAATPAYADDVKYVAAQKLLKNGKYRALGVSVDTSEGPGLYKYKFLDCQIPSPLVRKEDGSPAGVECKSIGKKAGYTQAQLATRRDEIQKQQDRDVYAGIAVGIAGAAVVFLVAAKMLGDNNSGGDNVVDAMGNLSAAVVTAGVAGVTLVAGNEAVQNMLDNGKSEMMAAESTTIAQTGQKNSVEVVALESLHPLMTDLFTFLSPIK